MNMPWMDMTMKSSFQKDVYEARADELEAYLKAFSGAGRSRRNHQASSVFEQVVLTRPPREGLRCAALMAAEESGEYF